MSKLLRFLCFICIIIGSVSCVATKSKSYKFNQKHSVNDFKQDVVVLKQVLEKHHPSLYWYTPKDTINSLFEKLINEQLADSLSELQCRNKLQNIVQQIKCGHTTVRFSKQFNELSVSKIYPLFPLQIKTWNDSMVVLARYNVSDSMLKRGTVITSINGWSASKILDKMFALISADGNANNHKSQVISGNFPLWYKYCFGLDSVYKIGYVNDYGKEQFVQVKWFKPQIDTTKKLDKPKTKVSTIKQPTRKQKRLALLESKRSLIIDSTTKTAYFKLSTFSGGKLPSFFRQSFSTIHKLQLKNVIFDLRENGGGRVKNAILLNKYLSKLAFKVGDTVAATRPTLSDGKYIGFHWAYTIAKMFGSKKMEDGLWHNRVYETKYFAPKKNLHFDGKIYLIQGGYTFSAATLFAGWLYHQNNVTIIGEESGGAFYGNSAMFIPSIYLPNTKLRVSLPLYKLVMDNYREKGRGIMPHIEVPPNSFAIKKGIDKKLEIVKQLIAIDTTKQQ